MTDIDAIRARVPAVYDGPWYVQPADDGRWLVGYPTDNPLAGLIATVPDYGEQLAEFIAAARTDVPALLAKVDELTAALAETREQVADYAADNARAVAQLVAANRRADGLANDLNSAVKANTAWANQSGEQQYLIWSHKQNAWWGPGGHGYRWAITSAGRFPLDRANDHANTRSWPADRKTPPEVVIPAPPLDVLADPERIDGWIDEQIKTATDAKIAARKAEQPAEATR